MNKIIYFLILSTLITSSLYSKEPTLAKLSKVYSNGYLKFGITHYDFLCKPYGVVSIDDLYIQSKINSECKNSIDRYYLKNPLDKYYTSMILKDRQYYHIEFRNNRCILYAKGMLTLSELLLRKGLAIKERNFNDLEFDNYFSQAQKNAIDNKVGMYEYGIDSKCSIELDELDKTDK